MLSRLRSAAHRDICPTSCSVWFATATCCGSTHPRSTPSRPATGCSMSAVEVSDMDFQLQSVPLLSRVGADRADQLRTDVDAATTGWADAALLRVDSRNQVLVANGRGGLGG